MEAVIPTEEIIPSPRYQWLGEEDNQNLMNFNLDKIDETRDRASFRLAIHQQKMARYFNKNVRSRTFRIEDWVLRKVFQNTKEHGDGKLGPNWESPYLIAEVVGK